MATIVAATGAAGNWTSGGAWVGGIAPTAADNVQITATTTSITIDAGALCRGADFTGFTGTLTQGATGTLTIGDATAALTNIALNMPSGFTYAPNSASTITFASTSATQQTVAADSGYSMGKIVFNSASNGNYAITANMTVAAAASLSVTKGTVHFDGASDTAGLSHTIGTLNLGSGSNVCVNNLGTAQFTINNNASIVLTTASSANNTLTAGTSKVTFNQASQTAQDFGNKTFYDVVINGPTAFRIGSNGGTFHSINMTGTAAVTASLQLSSNITVTSALILAGNNATTNRLLVQSLTLGTRFTITNTATTMTWSNVDFKDIGLTVSYDASAITGKSGNCGGNNNITFTTPATQTFSGTASDSWSTNAWTTRVPLPQDDVLISSAFSGAVTISLDCPRLGKSIDCSASTGTGLILNPTINPITIYGSWTLRAGIATTNSNIALTFEGRGSFTITNAGNTSNWYPTMQAFGGTYTLQDAWSFNQLVHNNGTLDNNGFNVTFGFLTSQSGLTRTWILGSGTTTCTAAFGFTSWNITSTGLTFTSTGSTVNLGTLNVLQNFTFAGGGLTYNIVQYNTAGNFGVMTVSGANTFTTLTIGTQHAVSFTSAVTQTVTNFNATGVNNGYVYFNGGSVVNLNYYSTPDSAAVSITGDIDIRCRVALDDWTPASACAVVDKWASAGNQRSYTFSVGTTGTLTLNISTDGSASTSSASSASVSFADGAIGWIRVTRAVTAGTTKYYTSTDSTNDPSAVSWTQLGIDKTISSGSNIFDSTTAVGMPATSGNVASTMIGKYYRCALYNGIGGTLAFDADFTTKPVGQNSFTESSSNAATVSTSGQQAELGDGRVQITSSIAASAGTLSKSSGQVVCDYLTLKDSTATGGAGWYAGANSVNVSGNTGWNFNSPLLPSVSDSITVSESVSITLVGGATTLTVSVSDSITVSESISMSARAPPFCSDLITVSESVTIQLLSYVSVSDSITVSESIVASVLSYVSVFDLATVSENVNVQLLSFVSVSDSATTSENIQLTVVCLPTVSDSISVSESVVVLLQSNILVFDSITLSESVSILIPILVPFVEDDISVSEFVRVDIQTSDIVNDAVTVSESVTTQMISYISVFDSITVSENVTVTVVSLISVSDSVAVNEFVNILNIANILVFESVSVSEQVSLLLTSFISVFDVVSVLEALSVLIPIDYISTSDSVSIAEVVTVAIQTTESLTDNIAVSESVVLFIPFVSISVSESIALFENISLLIPLLRVSTFDSIHISENVQIAVTLLFLTASESITVSESILAAVSVVVSIGTYILYSIYADYTIEQYQRDFILYLPPIVYDSILDQINDNN